jgi:flagellar basal-body rod protein FlgB
MISALFSQPSYVATKVSLDVTALRHEAIASNMANIETPGYKRIDVAPEFQAELNRAISSQDISQMSGTQPRLTVDSSAVSATRDGNTVQLETELLALNQNTLSHSLETQLVSGSLLKLQSAITGRSS